MKLRDRVALNIQDLRRARGLSQEELALRAGVNRGYMGKLENAKYAASLDMLEKIATALAIDASVLVAPRL
ncbi:helix-turn-helix transcriptional regulator [Phaeobacter italicus]|uniref:helix-turn-helix domain-containing protein n=1 Tax=Phaeobacter italicus TaxID=481446 RepID=UPI001ADAD2C1|nr:helix-turn-helix transcriptional regulator [Phaeobacter italicus]MBO9443896.1 helix-turn-helix transcriptional regulator [Phaeobacter italicus]